MKHVTILSLALLVGCASAHQKSGNMPPQASLPANIDQSAPSPLVTYLDLHPSGSVAIGAEGPIRITKDCIYIEAYQRKIVVVWPASLVEMLSPTSFRYGGRILRDGNWLNLRGQLHFDWPRHQWPAVSRNHPGCDFTNWMRTPRGRRRGEPADSR